MVASLNFPNTKTHLRAHGYRCHESVQVSAQNYSIMCHNSDRYQYNGSR